MQTGTFEKAVMPGEVEADETFVGVLERFKHKEKRQHLGRGGAGKSIVNDAKRFERLAEGVAGKRITYADLTGRAVAE